MYFGDDDAIYDVIIQEPVWKWRHNYLHEISRDPFAESVLFQTCSTIFIFRQINRANFAVRGPSSLTPFTQGYFVPSLGDTLENIFYCQSSFAIWLYIISSSPLLKKNQHPWILFI